jgi:hypothetical protein
MKKWILISVMLGAMPLSMLAQDDVYFVPKKKSASQSHSAYYSSRQPSTHYSGSSRSVEEYNRRGGSSYDVIPGDSSDIISFSGEVGVYPDSIEDFSLTKRMARFDEYIPADEYGLGYIDGMVGSWHSPWFYSFYPWYDGWYYDPWYYHRWGWSWPWSYYDPWYYGWHHPYYGWYDRTYYPHHGYYGGGYAGRYREGYHPSTGTLSHGRIVNSGHRSTVYSRNANNRGIGAVRSTGTAGRTTVGSSRSTSGSVYSSNSRTSNSTYTPSRSASTSTYTPSRSSSSGIGSSRSTSGSSYGGGGGGSFGGGRSSGGGGGGGSSRSAGRR